MVNLIVDYELTSKIIDSIDDKKFDGSDRMEYSEFKKEINEFGKKATLNKYDLHKFITEEKPLGYFMILWERVYRKWSTPYKAFSDINKYEIIDYNYRDANERLIIHYDLLRIYVDKLFGIDLKTLDSHAVDRLFKMMDSDNKVVLLKNGMAVFAW